MVLMSMAATVREYPRVVHLLCQALARVLARLEGTVGQEESIEAYGLLGSRLGQGELAEGPALGSAPRAQTPPSDEQRSTYPLPAPGHPPLVWTQPLRSRPEHAEHAPRSRSTKRLPALVVEADGFQPGSSEMPEPLLPAEDEGGARQERPEHVAAEEDAEGEPARTSRPDR